MLYSKMKFKAILAFTILILFSFNIYSNPVNVMAKSNSGNTASVSKDEAVLIKRTTKYVSQFKKGNFDDFYKASTEEIQKNITTSILKQGWDWLLERTGKTRKLISCTYSKQNGQSVVAARTECTLYDILVTITYNTKGKPCGIRSTFIPKELPNPQTTDKWEEFPTAVGDKKLLGMLTLPKGVKNPPVVIMIQGSGASDLNESVGTVPNRPFEDIAHGLAELGVATLRYNKSTYQYPAGFCDSIEYEVLDDAAAAVKMLSSDKRIDTDHIYLLGHSLGGMMAPKMAADNPQIKGFIAMAGSLRLLQEIILDQNKAALNADTSLTEQQKNALLAPLIAEMEKSKTLEDGGTNYIMDIPTSYWKSLNAIDNTAIVKKLDVPMLILQGSADFQVYTDTDYKLWQTVLKDHTNVTYHLYDGLSHEFMPNQLSKNGVPDATVYNSPNHVDSKVIADIAAWVKGQ